MSARRGRRATVTARQPDSVMYRCSLGGEFKPIGAFSDNQKLKAGYGVKKIDPNFSRMICREHAPGNNTAYKCEGPCNKTLPLEYFSKNTRREGVYVCVECREWIDSEPDPAQRAKEAAQEIEEELSAANSTTPTPAIPRSGAPRRPFNDFPCDVSDVASSQDTGGYGFLEHLLEDEEEEDDSDDTISMSTLSLDKAARSSTTQQTVPVSATMRAPLIAMSSATSARSGHRAKKFVPPAGAEMSSVASNSWYGGQVKDDKKTHVPAPRAGPSTSRISPPDAATPKLAPHEWVPTIKSETQPQAIEACAPNVPPHLRPSKASARSGTEKKLAPHEMVSLSSTYAASDTDTKSDADSVHTVQVARRGENTRPAERSPCIINQEYKIARELRRPTRKIHKDQQQWLMAQPLCVLDDDSDRDSN